jgi:hypothetical protein
MCCSGHHDSHRYQRYQRTSSGWNFWTICDGIYAKSRPAVECIKELEEIAVNAEWTEGVEGSDRVSEIGVDGGRLPLKLMSVTMEGQYSGSISVDVRRMTRMFCMLGKLRRMLDIAINIYSINCIR